MPLEQELRDFVFSKLLEHFPYMKTDIARAMAEQCKEIVAEGVAAQ